MLDLLGWRLRLRRVLIPKLKTSGSCIATDWVEKYQALINILKLSKREDREQGRAGEELDLHSDKAEKIAGLLKRMSRKRKIYASKHRN